MSDMRGGSRVGNKYIATTDYVDQSLDGKVNKTGDTMGKLTVQHGVEGTPMWNNCTLEIKSNGSNIAALSFHRPGFTQQNIWHSENGFIDTDANIRVNGNTVWHAGNLNPANYAPSGYGLGTAATWIDQQDLNTLKVTGFYRGHNNPNRPPLGSANHCHYLVMRHDDNWIAQTAYDFDGVGVWTRVFRSGSNWSSWRRLDTHDKFPDGSSSWRPRSAAEGWNYLGGVGSNGGECAFYEKDSKLHFITNGEYYANEGQFVVWNAGNDGSGSGLDADILDGLHASDLEYISSKRDFINGTLIRTDIWSADWAGASFLFEIVGNSYGGCIPFNIKVQGYIYNNTIINFGGICTGRYIPEIRLFNYNNHLCMWFPRQDYWQGFSVFACDTSAEGTRVNRVVAIDDVAKPADISKEVALTPEKVWSSGNDGDGSGLDADTLDGVHGISQLAGSNRQYFLHDGDYRSNAGGGQVADLNDAIYPGFYHVNPTVTTNVPGGLWGHLWVWRYNGDTNPNWLVQEFVGSGSARKFFRLKSNGSWGAWHELWHTGNFDPGTKLNLSGGSMSGKLWLAAGDGNGIGFPNDAFGGGGDCAGIKLISKDGAEATELRIYVGNDSPDTINFMTGVNSAGVYNAAVMINGNVIWNGGYQGSGTGMDADLLDGKHASSFAPSGYGLGGTCTDVTYGNANDVITTGFYMGYNMSNVPNDGHPWKYLTVLRHNEIHAVQYLTDFSGINSWYRAMAGGVWGPWKKIIDIDNFKELDFYNQYMSNHDSNGVATVVEYKRPADGTLYMKSTLSGGASPNYTTDTWQYFAADGVTVILTKTWTMSYDGNGNILSKVVS